MAGTGPSHHGPTFLSLKKGSTFQKQKGAVKK